MGANESNQQAEDPSTPPFPPPNFLVPPTKLNDPFGDTERLDYAPSPLHQLQTRTLLLRLLPPEIVLDILDLAHYYHRETASSTQSMVVAQGRSINTSAPVRRRGRLEEIRFGMKSHDQGWSDTARENRGTYKGSSSFFEAAVFQSLPGLPVSTQVHRHQETIQYNQNAVSAYKTHLVTFERDRTHSSNTSTDPPPSPSLIAVAVEAAKEAETTIALVAVAQYPGWQNHVAAGRIDLYYSHFYPLSE